MGRTSPSRGCEYLSLCQPHAQSMASGMAIWSHLLGFGLSCISLCVCSIVGSGTEYRISGNVVSAADYQKNLESLGIYIKAKNFLVFQVHLQECATANVFRNIFCVQLTPANACQPPTLVLEFLLKLTSNFF